MTDNDFWDAIRRWLLTGVDIIEKKRGISPRTSELRQAWKRGWTPIVPLDRSVRKRPRVASGQET